MYINHIFYKMYNLKLQYNIIDLNEMKNVIFFRTLNAIMKIN